MTPASPNRTRILSCLRRLLIPGDRNRYTIPPTVFQTIAHGLFLLDAYLHSPQAGNGNQADLQQVKELTEQFCFAGSYGDMTEALIEEEYGVSWLPEDSRAGTRRLIVLEALLRCLENCALQVRIWLTLNMMEVGACSFLHDDRSQ